MDFAVNHKRYNFTVEKMRSMFELTKTLNRNQDFLDFREKSLTLILSVCTFGGAAVVIVWHFFDYFRFHDIATSLVILRSATITLFILNWLLARINLFNI